MYIHQRKNWPQFHWDKNLISKQLIETRHRQGLLLGRMETLGFQLRQQATLDTLTEDVLKSSEIEGETLNRKQVRSSIARHLGVDTGALLPIDRNIEGVVEMVLDAVENHEDPLTEERLFGWHAALFPTGRSAMHRIRVGRWRNDKSGPMRVVSGSMGRERTHFEAPTADRLSEEMSLFCKWFNGSDQEDLVLKAALAHLWFVTIHPFDDGNGRIARAITDLLLARSEKSQKRFYSMSAQIRIERKNYYTVLEQTQKGTLDISEWLHWFLACLDRAFEGAEILLANVLAKNRFWKSLAGESFNERQTKILNRLLDGFKGKLTSSKWAKLAKCSQDSAHRDITDLIQRGILAQNQAGGRSTSYVLIHPITAQT